LLTLKGNDLFTNERRPQTGGRATRGGSAFTGLADERIAAGLGGGLLRRKQAGHHYGFEQEYCYFEADNKLLP
jgi:hypothetical protein